MTDTEILEAMRSMLAAERENTRQMLEPINNRLDAIQEDITQIKEDAAEIRTTVNAIGEWTEAAADVLKIKYPI